MFSYFKKSKIHIDLIIISFFKLPLTLKLCDMNKQRAAGKTAVHIARTCDFFYKSVMHGETLIILRSTIHSNKTLSESLKKALYCLNDINNFKNFTSVSKSFYDKHLPLNFYVLLLHNSYLILAALWCRYYIKIYQVFTFNLFSSHILILTTFIFYIFWDCQVNHSWMRKKYFWLFLFRDYQQITFIMSSSPNTDFVSWVKKNTTTLTDNIKLDGVASYLGMPFKIK